MKPKKTFTCDWCGKARSDLLPVGGETSACFLCRKEASRGRVFDEKQKRYVHLEDQ